MVTLQLLVSFRVVCSGRLSLTKNTRHNSEALAGLPAALLPEAVKEILVQKGDMIAQPFSWSVFFFFFKHSVFFYHLSYLMSGEKW